MNSAKISNERRQAVDKTREFLYDLTDLRADIPRDIRLKAFELIQHFPGKHCMESAAEEMPLWFG